METVELFDIEEDEVKGILDVIPVYWYRWKDILEPSLVPVLRKFGKRNNLLFGVHIFACGKNGIVTILSEYLTDLKTVNFEISGVSLSNWSGPRDDVGVESRISEIIEDILQEEHASPTEIFVCPECEAAYIIDLEHDVENGMIECQGCGKLMKFRKNLVPPEL